MAFYAMRANSRNRELCESGVPRLGRVRDAPPMPKRLNSLSPEAAAFQAKLRIWRKSRKLTLEALAEQTGYAVSTLHGWEKGHREVGTEDLVRLAAVYGVHPAALLMAPEEANPKVDRMIRASGLAERLGSQSAEQWLAIGETLASDKRGD